MTELGKKIQAEILEEVKTKAKSVVTYVDLDGEQKEFYPLNDTAVEIANLFNRRGCTVLSIRPNSLYQGEKTDA
jgi:hypothetical protein